MARAPSPPDITQKKSFLRFAIEYVLKFVFGLWAVSQLVGIIFYLIWRYSSHGFKEFMFRDYITLWDKWSYEILPSWFFKIPTWTDPVVWAVGGIVILFLIVKRARMPSLPQPKPKHPKTMGKPFKGKPARNADKTTFPDDDFSFDPNAFKKGEPAEQSQKEKTDKYHPDDVALWDVVNDAESTSGERKTALEIIMEREAGRKD